MSNQQQEQSQDESKTKKPPSTLPKAMEKRVSLKWVTMQALDAAVSRMKAQGGQARVTVLTAYGRITGELQEIQSSYAESFEKQENGTYRPDLASMVTHLRSEMLRRFEEEEKQLEIVDTAPILSLKDVEVAQVGQSPLRLPQLTLFADQVIGFTVEELPTLH
ncbi:hypothetical protein [Tumebacillus flagellatus]|uniref:Uncharacterized protein n=1 Tax=Tumebacillus flagellatus TaxID=1157490 RepID=A0A074LQF1_9BACL|nr:hypothetical protein [Tumebacillus flagellatus]KEO84376.1 hypothetical protein EL26_04540 [Tumebacillus flagellatus]